MKAFYDFRCVTCKKEFELFVSYDDIRNVSCPHCKSKTVKKIIKTIVPVIYLGTGFYSTDHRKEEK